MNQELLIETQKTLVFTNVAIYHEKMNPVEVQAHLSTFLSQLDVSGCKKNGPLITANIRSEHHEQLIEMKIIVPVTNSECIPKKYNYEPEIILENLLFHRYIGDPHKIQEAFSSIMKYIADNDLTYANIYNVHIDEGLTIGSNQLIIDIYIEVTGQ